MRACFALLRGILWVLSVSVLAAAQTIPAASLAVRAGEIQTTSQAQLTHGPLLGAVSATTIRIWARADRGAQLKVEHTPFAAAWPGKMSTATTLSDARDFTGTVLISGLTPETQYRYRLLLDGVVVAKSEGRFATVAAPSAPATFTFALGADLRFSQQPYPILDHIVERAPAFMLMLGDQIYSDIPVIIADDLDLYEQKYREQWAESHFRNLVSAVPTFMILDDHEIIDNWDGGKSGRYGNAITAYDEYQGSHNPRPRVAGEKYYTFSVGLADFYVLDTRTFRSDKDAVDEANRTMLGAAQKADLKRWLASARGHFKFIVTSVPWHSAIGGPDSWHGYGAERAELSNYIRDHCIRGVVFLSGDQHYAAIVRSELAPGQYLYEISPTPLGTAPHEFRSTIAEKEVLLSYNASRAFGLIEVDTNDPPRLTIDVITADNTSALPGGQPLVITDQEMSPACQSR